MTSFSVNEWKTKHSLKFLGIPRFISKGLFVAPNKQSCRFLIMDRFIDSLEDCLKRGEITPVDIPQVAIQTVSRIGSFFANLCINPTLMDDCF